MSVRAALAVFLLFAGAVPAAALDMPANAVLTTENGETLGSLAIPIGPFAKGIVEKHRLEGAVLHRAWKLRGGGATTLRIFTPLRAALIADGYEPVFECETQACGGFDFRYETKVLAEPDMHVDLGDFRYLAARKVAGAGEEMLALLVSRSSENGFVQISRVGPEGSLPLAVTLSAKNPAARPILDDAAGADPVAVVVAPPPAPEGAPMASGGLAAALERTGAAVLDDLDFATGSAELGAGPFASLSELAAYLQAYPAARVALVGHTDADGGLAGNIALSRRRAAAVADRLTAAHGIAAGRLAAEGVGFLAPRASNLTGDGRRFNRRVEVVLTATE